MGHIVVAWQWLDQLTVVLDQAGDFYEGKRRAAAYFLTWELPIVDSVLDRLEVVDATNLQMQDVWF